MSKPIDLRRFLLDPKSDLWNKSIYRIVDINRLFSMIESNENVLASPSLWTDPWENMILNSEIITGGKKVFLEYRDKLYGQCWSRQYQNEAMWRIYSPNGFGARIKTTVGKLFVSLYSFLGTSVYRDISCFIGTVRYIKPADIRAMTFDLTSDSDGRKSASTLLLKRMAYDHEKEIRIIYHDVNKTNTENIFKYKFQFDNVIEGIMFDPQMSDSLFNVLKTHLKTNLKFPGTVSRSVLYKKPGKVEIKI